jgi:hypothetical protein
MVQAGNMICRVERVAAKAAAGLAACPKSTGGKTTSTKTTTKTV